MTKKKGDPKITMRVGDGPEIELTGDRDKDAAQLAPQLREAFAGRGLMRGYDDDSRQLTEELVLAIEDTEFAERIRETRVYPPAECGNEQRISRLRAKMLEMGVLDETNEAGRRNLARLRALVDEPGNLYDLEEEFLEEIERVKHGNWISRDDYIIHNEAVEISTFVIKTYRRDLIGFRIAVVMAKEIPAVNRRSRLGTAARLPGKMRFLSEWDALVTLDWGRWSHLSDKDRQRLIHHELLHLERGDKGQLQIRTHDFEEFIEVVDIYGLKSESGVFPTDGHVADGLRNASAQLELLERSA